MKRENPTPRDLRPVIWSASREMCAYCDERLELDGPWHMEHVYPRQIGGMTVFSNLVASCAICNRTAWHGDFETIAEKRAYIRAERGLPPLRDDSARFCYLDPKRRPKWAFRPQMTA